MTFSLVTIVFDDGKLDASGTCSRILSVHESAVVSGEDFDMIVIDNSERPIMEVQNLCADLNAVHQWNSGFNVYHGGSMNIAAKLSNKDAVIYFCSGHCTVFDNTWIKDILEPLNDEKCGISGCVAPFLFDRISAEKKDHMIPQRHVQGAISAMRRETLLKIPYGNRFPHNYSDVSMSLSLIKAGYKLSNVPSVRSVGVGKASKAGAKITHDY